MSTFWTPQGERAMPGPSKRPVGPVVDSLQALTRAASQALSDGREKGLHDTSDQIAEMRMNRKANMRKEGTIGGGYNSGISFATARPRDPMFYWRETNLPFEYEREEELTKLRAYARLVALTHPTMAACIDVYSYWPLTGMHVNQSDDSIRDFYEELFFDEAHHLSYEEFLPQVLHETFLSGEAFPMGHFNEILGIWEYDELINADDVKVIKSPFIREPRFELRVPEDIRTIIANREPPWEYEKLTQAYPELVRYAQSQELMPVSNVLMQQVAFKCLTLGTQVMTPSGPIEARRLERGDRVVAWDEKTNTPVFSQVTYIEDNGTKPIHHVRTQQGRSVRVTGNHPFLTDQGWVDASLLIPGSRLVVGANNDHRSKYLDLDVARFLGMMMGDGSCGTKRSSQTIKFHNIDTELLDWLNEFVGRYDCHLVLDRMCSWLVTRIDGGKGPTRLNAVRSLLKEVGLFGQNTFTKRVPQVVWQGGPKAWAVFLSGYFDTDGYYNAGRGIATWISANRLLLEDCQTLLAYLGVNSTVQEIKAPSVTTMKKNGEMRQPYRLVVSRRYTSMLASLLTPLLPRKQIVDRGWYQRKLTAQQAEDIRQRVLAGEKQNALAKEYGVGTSSVQAIIRGKSFAPVEPVLYDKVVSVTVEDPELTLAIGVEKYRNFITGGLVTHNSDKFHHRGLPIMMRAFRALYQEEMLNAAMDSIASRLYTPLILVRLGASATDLGTDSAWVPTPQQLEEFQESLDIALAADFRVLTSHFATEVDLVFGREAMPDFGPDFDRLLDKQLLAFGLSRTMLMGGAGDQTYAADAINRDLVSVHPDTRVVFNQPWRGLCLRTMQQIWDQLSQYHEVLNKDGWEIIQPPRENAPYSLCFNHGMGEWGRISNIGRHWYKGLLVHMVQKWGEIWVTPNHSVYNSHAQLVSPTTNPELLALRSLNQKFLPQDDQITLKCPFARLQDGWAQRLFDVGGRSHSGAPRKVQASDVPTILSLRNQGLTYSAIGDQYGVTGSAISAIIKGKRLRHWREELEDGTERLSLSQRLSKSRLKVALKGDDLKNFLRFLGAFISEGSVSPVESKSATRGRNDGRKWVIQIANTQREWLEWIAACMDCFVGRDANIAKGSDPQEGYLQGWSVVSYNSVLGQWLVDNAGRGSYNKRLPDFVFGLDWEYVEVLLDHMVMGDGSIRKKGGHWSYHSGSGELIHGVSLLCLLHDIQFTIGKNPRTGIYTINTCGFYETRPNETPLYEEIEYEGWVYDFEMEDSKVANFAIGPGHVVVHNTQMLTRAQKWIKKLFAQRARVVAEAQEHYEVDQKGGQRVPVIQEVMEVDPRTGERKIVQKKKLVTPKLEMDVLNLHDQEAMRQFIETLVGAGVPISNATRLRNIPIDLNEELEKIQKEKTDEAVATQETRKAIYLALHADALPIPQDLIDDFEPKPLEMQQPSADPNLPTPNPMMDIPTSAVLAPTAEDYAQGDESQMPGGTPGQAPVPIPGMMMPYPTADPPGAQRPSESDQERATMPKAAVVNLDADDLAYLNGNGNGTH